MKIIKEVKYEVTYPGGRVINGFNSYPCATLDNPFQIFSGKDGSESFIINPKNCESIKINIKYEE